MSPSQFESHAGIYRHIYTSNGLSLHDIAISLANGQNITTGIGDDMCAEVGDGGDLMFCQSCPRAFHAVANSDGKESQPRRSFVAFGGCCNFSSEFLCAFLDVCFLFPLTQAAIMQRTV
ncbi:hypothetical protein Peur_036966 [Populus x canadensis]